MIVSFAAYSNAAGRPVFTIIFWVGDATLEWWSRV
eukprot:SAG31_NODE_5219_length_2669_cov_1.862646_4_plen_35_part_00